MIELMFHSRVPLVPLDISRYIHELRVSVVVSDEHSEKFMLGWMSADRLCLADICDDGEDVLQVCDQDSQGMTELYEALFSEEGEFAEELALDLPTDQILFIWRAVLHPKLRPFEQEILDGVCRHYGAATVVAMWRSATQLSDRELSDLGFAKIAGTEFVYRHMGVESRYSSADREDMDLPEDIRPTASDEEEVRRRWNAEERG